MKNSVLFKTLIDIFFFAHVIVLIGIVVNLFTGIIGLDDTETLQFWEWAILAISGIVSFVFLRGLFFLRKMARLFLSQKYFSQLVVDYMKTAGNQFVYAGLLSVLIVVVDYFSDLNLELIYNTISITPIFLVIVGLFFIIQSATLLNAIKLKNENDLTV